MANKGGPFERAFAKELSLWWSHGEDDDLCWRTAGSGGRSTVRARKGKKTAGHCGDLGATDHTMLPFFRLITVELKRGYNGTANLHNLFDPPRRTAAKSKGRTYKSFLQQTVAAANRAETPHWLLVHRPDRKKSVFFTSADLAIELKSLAGVRFTAPCAVIDLGGTKCVFGTLANFMKDVCPEDIQLVHDYVLGG